MAICVEFTPGNLFSGTTTTKINAGAAWNSTSGSGGTVVNAVGYAKTTPTKDSAGNWACNAATYLLLTPDEVNLMRVPNSGTAEQYAAISTVFAAGITALAVIWGVKRVLIVFNSHTES